MYRWSVILSLCCGLLWGCSGEIHDKRYLTAKNGPKLTTPPGLSDTRISSYYFLPEPRGDVDVSIIPPGSILQQEASGVRS
jgi:uncharacterized lipoprotein